MPQDTNTMKFCFNCRMNVFPSRPIFNVKMFVICVLIMFPIIVTINLVFFFAFFVLFNFIFLIWGFMLFNPYLIFYGLKKKQYCPRCYQKVIEKNLDYQPFGEKEPEIFTVLSPSKVPNHDVNRSTLKE
ncbi:MAG: hypothetical protein ACTSRI_13745 [Promethearchaeota archaeon]